MITEKTGKLGEAKPSPQPPPLLREGEKESVPAAKPRVRLEFLDGIRALAALYVVFNHASIMTMKMVDGHVPSILRKLLHVLHFYVFNYGVYAVDVFIVLSGFCLMLPVARSEEYALEGGFWGFMKRRAWRIMPPYYAALALCLLFFAIAPRVGVDVNAMSWADIVAPVFSTGSIVSHLLLLHAWTPWRSTIDPPMWSVSTEWCIYFFFPLLLLPVFRRWGAWASTMVAFAVGLAPHYLGAASLDRMYPWYLGLFGLGMAGAIIGFSGRPAHRSTFERVPWGVGFAGFIAVIIALTSVQRASLAHSASVHFLREETWGSRWPFDALVGLATVCLMLHCTRMVKEGQTSTLVSLFASKPVVALGVFSYSLYLVHAPVLEIFWLLLRKSSMGSTHQVLIFALLSAPLCIGLAYLFHLPFERPFLRSRKKADTPLPQPLTPSGKGEQEPVRRKDGQLRLEFLDGLRGLAALYVAASHIGGDNLGDIPAHARWAFGWLHNGRLAVDVFIVLSGYCLMLPVARSANADLRGGTWTYLMRRARRILPPYYAALALSILVLLLSHAGMAYLRGHRTGEVGAMLTPWNVISHALLIHNWNPASNMSIDGPLWSVATEWQIYFLLPLVLLPVYRRFGAPATIAAGFAVGLAPHFLLPRSYNFDWAAPWFVGLFSLGVAGAAIGFSENELCRKLRMSIPWSIVATVGAVLVVAALSMPGYTYTRFSIAIDVLMGLEAIALIVACTGHAVQYPEKRLPWIVRLLDSRWAVALGGFSYSLYLTHRIAMEKLYPLVGALHLGIVGERVALLAIGVPWVLIFAYLFHLVFERPFLSTSAAKPNTAPAPVPLAEGAAAQ